MLTGHHLSRACVDLPAAHTVTFECDHLCLVRAAGPLMQAHAQAVAGARGDVLNVGFGMGLVDAAIQVGFMGPARGSCGVLWHLAALPAAGEASLHGHCLGKHTCFTL